MNITKFMTDHLKAVKSNSRAPLPYGMYFTRVLRWYNIDVDGEQADYVKRTDYINKTTLKRMGYTLQGASWVLSKEKTKEASQSTPHSHQADQAEEEEDEIPQKTEEERREEAAVEEETEPVATSPTSSQPSIKSIASLKTFFTKSLNKLQTHLNS